MARSGVCLLFAAVISVVSLLAAPVNAGDSDDARPYLAKAKAAYGLGHYAVAAENFEKAFEVLAQVHGAHAALAQHGYDSVAPDRFPDHRSGRC